MLDLAKIGPKDVHYDLGSGDGRTVITAAKRGAKLIVMDPRGQNQGISRYASHVLQFKPGRDVALLNALLNVIVTEGMVDIQYVQAHTEGYESLQQRIKDFAPEKMEEVCGPRSGEAVFERVAG